MIPYEPRKITFLGTANERGFSLKTYSIVYADGGLNRNVFDLGFRAAIARLPQPAVAPGRPGLGFVIMHQGQTGDYVVLCWWDNENELPIRVFVRDESGWRTARDAESICVWDLQIIWHERCAYVETMLSGNRSPQADAYLARQFNGVSQSFCAD